MPRLLLTALLGIGLLLAIALTGNADAVDLENIQDDAAVPAGELETHSIGQTFVAHQPNLNAIELRWIVSGDVTTAKNNFAVLHLRRAGTNTDLVRTDLPINTLRHNNFARFTFPPIPDSQNQVFYFWVELSSNNLTRVSISLWASGEDNYPDGALVIDGISTNRDLAFRTYYQPDATALIATALSALAENFFALVIIICVPAILGGLILVSVGTRGSNFIYATALGLAGLSASALLVVKFGILIDWGIIFVLALVALWRWRKNRTLELPRLNSTNIVLIALAALSLAVGLLQIRNLPVPLWVDSPAHVDYVQTLASNKTNALGGFYHFGFHSAAALLAQLAGIPIPQFMLIFGQWLLTLAGLATFALTQKIIGNVNAGITSASCVWFLAPTPAYFITWGRYPLVFGIALLPIALCLAIEFIDREQFDAGIFTLAILACIGLVFAHLRLAVPYTTFLILYLIVRAKNWRAIFLLAIGALGGVIWIGAFVASGMPLATILARNAEGVELVDMPTASAVLLTQHGALVWLIAGTSLLIAIVLRRQNAFLIGGWALATFFIAFAPVSSSLIAPSFVMLLAFIPASLAIGEMVALVTIPNKIESMMLIILIGASVLGAYSMQSIVNPATVLFTNADAAALNWLARNSPADTRVLINSFAWFGNTYLPSDGGIWLAQQTGRRAIFLTASNSPADFAGWLDTNPVAYIYLGRRTGLLTKTQFACQPEHYTPVYYRGGVAIFATKNSRVESPSIQLPFTCSP